jgi:hypothetical protein
MSINRADVSIPDGADPRLAAPEDGAAGHAEQQQQQQQQQEPQPMDLALDAGLPLQQQEGQGQQPQPQQQPIAPLPVAVNSAADAAVEDAERALAQARGAVSWR